MKRLTTRNQNGRAYYPECFERCKGEGGDCLNCEFEMQISEKLCMYEELEEKYHWHDLRKNLDDLPEMEYEGPDPDYEYEEGETCPEYFSKQELLLEVKCCDKTKYMIGCIEKWSDGELTADDGSELVAWRYIEPFEEGGTDD